jgi:hypothetical protein
MVLPGHRPGGLPPVHGEVRVSWAIYRRIQKVLPLRLNASPTCLHRADSASHPPPSSPLSLTGQDVLHHNMCVTFGSGHTHCHADAFVDSMAPKGNHDEIAPLPPPSIESNCSNSEDEDEQGGATLNVGPASNALVTPTNPSFNHNHNILKIPVSALPTAFEQMSVKSTPVKSGTASLAQMMKSTSYVMGQSLTPPSAHRRLIGSSKRRSRLTYTMLKIFVGLMLSRPIR